MNVNDEMLSIPPYISTSWNNISALYMRKGNNGQPLLVVVLHNGTNIEVPKLDSFAVKRVFAAHRKFVEKKEGTLSDFSQTSSSSQNQDIAISLGLPFKLDGASMNMFEGIGGLLQHNPDQKQMPNLPSGLIGKVTSLIKSFGLDRCELLDPSKAEPHCNCLYCQMVRALHDEPSQQGEGEEEVSDEDLTFQDWEVKQEGDKLYLVTNPLDRDERYRVFLGKPLGCTCGKTNCEHIRMVLSS